MFGVVRPTDPEPVRAKRPRRVDAKASEAEVAGKITPATQAGALLGTTVSTYPFVASTGRGAAGACRAARAVEVDQHLRVVLDRLGDLLRDGHRFVQVLRFDVRDEHVVRRQMFGDRPARPAGCASGAPAVDRSAAAPHEREASASARRGQGEHRDPAEQPSARRRRAVPFDTCAMVIDLRR